MDGRENSELHTWFRHKLINLISYLFSMGHSPVTHSIWGVIFVLHVLTSCSTSLKIKRSPVFQNSHTGFVLYDLEKRKLVDEFNGSKILYPSLQYQNPDFVGWAENTGRFGARSSIPKKRRFHINIWDGRPYFSESGFRLRSSLQLFGPVDRPDIFCCAILGR